MHTKCTLRHRTDDGTVGSIDCVELDTPFAQAFQVRGVDRSHPSGVIDERNANARRLVACWNACNGIDLEYLEGDDSLPHFARRMMEQRDDMLKALKLALPFLPKSSASDGGASKYAGAVHAADIVRAAIAMVEDRKS